MYEAVREYIAGLVITQGHGEGEPFQILPWQDKLLRVLFAVEEEERKRKAGASMGRGNGKSTLVAALGCAFLDGPLRQKRGQFSAIASSFDLGYEALFEPVKWTLEAHDNPAFKVLDSSNRARIEHKATGAKFRLHAANAKTVHGLAGPFFVIDESAQYNPVQRAVEMFNACETAAGKMPGSLTLAIGTKPETDAHPFSRLLDEEQSVLYCADPDADPFDEEQWRLANPAYDYFPNLRDAIAEHAEDAKKDPEKLASFKNYRLNLGTAEYLRQHILDAEIWQRIEGEAKAEGPTCWGIDLGDTGAQSCVACYWPRTGRLEVIAAFPALPDLSDRGRADGVGSLYVDLYRKGELLIIGHRTVDRDKLLLEAFRRFGGAPLRVGADTWRFGDLASALHDAEINGERCFPNTRLITRRQGFQDGSEDLRLFREAAHTDGQLVPVPSLLMPAALEGAIAVADTNRNWKLAKRSEGGRRQMHRDDAVAAAIQAVSAWFREPTEETSMPFSRHVAGEEG